VECLTDAEKYLLALYLKRVTFDQVLECTDGGRDKDQAYQIINVIGKVQEELGRCGVAPR